MDQSHAKKPNEVIEVILTRVIREWREALEPYETLMRLQNEPSGIGMSSLPVSLVRAICQSLTHADIETSRLVCQDWRRYFGEATVTDLYMAMCSDYERANQLVARFTSAFPNFHHLHFWIPGGPVRQIMGTNGDTFRQYMDMFSASGVRALTAHYLDADVCPIQGITKLNDLTKLELVDLMPPSASLASLSSLKRLSHLIVEYKDISAAPNLRSIGQIHGLTHIELSLHSSLINSQMYVTLPASSISSDVGGSDTAQVASSSSECHGWLLPVLAHGDASYVTGGAFGEGEERPSLASLAASIQSLISAAASAPTLLGNASLSDASASGAEASASAGPLALLFLGSADSRESSETLEPEAASAENHAGDTLFAGEGSSPEEAEDCDDRSQEDSEVRSERTSGSVSTWLYGTCPADASADEGAKPMHEGDRDSALAAPEVRSSSPSRSSSLSSSAPAETPAEAPWPPGEMTIEDILNEIQYGDDFPLELIPPLSGPLPTMGPPLPLPPEIAAPSPPSCLRPLSAAAPPFVPSRTFCVAVSDYLLAHMATHWTQLRHLRCLEIRNCPAGLCQQYPHLSQALPSLTELRLIGPDSRLKEAYGPSQPSFMVEVTRDPTTLAMVPATLALSLHCDSPPAARSAIRHLILLAAAAVPPREDKRSCSPSGSNGSSEQGNSTPSVANNSNPGLSRACPQASTTSVAEAAAAGGVPPSGRRAPSPSMPSHQLWGGGPSSGSASPGTPSSMGSGSGRAGQQQQQQAGPALSAALSAAEERRRHLLLRQHPGLAMLEAGPARVRTLRLYLDNPEFSSLKALACLGHLRELSLVVCHSLESDSETDSESNDNDSNSDDDFVGIFDDIIFSSPPLHNNNLNLSLDTLNADGDYSLIHNGNEAPSSSAVAATGGTSSVADGATGGTSAATPASEIPPDKGLKEEDLPPEATTPITTTAAQAAPSAGGGSRPVSTSGGPSPPAGSSLQPDPHAPPPLILPDGPTTTFATSSPAVVATTTPDPLTNPWIALSPHPSPVPPPSLQQALGPRHVLSALLHRCPGRHSCLTHLTVREEIPSNTSNEDGSHSSHESCSLGPLSAQLLSLGLSGLIHLEWQGLLQAPHPSSLSPLTGLTALKGLTLSVNQDDPVARLGMHCLPSSLTTLTLQNISVAPSPMGSSHVLPLLCHLHLKSCAVPDLPTFSAAPAVEWLSLDNCDVSMYPQDIVLLWPRLSWLEVTYTHQDWALLHCQSDLVALRQLTRLRKLSLVTPYEEHLTVDGLLALSQLRLLSISPSPAMSGHEQVMRLSKFRFLAGLEVKLYSDVPHHAEHLVDAGSIHADMQEALPMTDVLVMVDDSYADEPTVGGS